jgi:hypothetical protein
MRLIDWKGWVWSAVVRRLARSQGFLDPMKILAQLRRFGQPAELLAPTELLRAGAVFHARGLLNSQAIQHNLDWIWPHWVVRQFDPLDRAFVPRAFSITHINLTHRNWTAVGLPEVSDLPIVDPRGLVTPKLDGWSLDGWIVTDEGELIPSREETTEQALELLGGLSVVTRTGISLGTLVTAADVIWEGGASCRIRMTGQAGARGWLVVALRPCNPEGISLIYNVSVPPDGAGWLVNKQDHVRFSSKPDGFAFSRYHLGDVYHRLTAAPEDHHVHDPVGMATAAALFRLEPDVERTVTVTVPLGAHGGSNHQAPPRDASTAWADALKGHCTVAVPDPQWQFLYDAAIHTLILHAPDEVYPGPYTYKRFWFRDAAFIVHAMLCAGLTARAERVLHRFPSRQKANGHFCSQDGEWDSNGQVLWIYEQFCRITNRPLPADWEGPARRAAAWIQRRRMPGAPPSPHAGLLPVGFSAEHLGPNDYYYWDDFWGVAGLMAAAQLAQRAGDQDASARWRREAEAFSGALDHSIELARSRLGTQAVPASPYRRLDAGSIGSIAAGYPLRQWDASDARLLQTVEFLLTHCFVGGGFFQNISHSGINPYLTLHVAQVLLRAGDRRYLDLMEAISRLASPTGQWPEAIHPATLGGCMGDGQHVWAAAEWLLMVRNCFVREEGNRTLILCAGLPAAWFRKPVTVTFGPAPTEHGSIALSIVAAPPRVRVSWTASWHGEPVRLLVRAPGFRYASPGPSETSIVLEPAS